MSIVDEPRAAPAPNAGLGWGLGLLLIVGDFIYLMVSMTSNQDRLAQVARAAHASYWWTDSSIVLLVGGLFWSILGLFIVLMACGLVVRPLPDLSLWRWPLVAVAYGGAVAFAAANTSLGLRGGYADDAQVTWIAQGQAPVTRRWEAAQGLQASCEMTGRRRDTASFDYEVFFEGGRSARLGYGHAPTTDPVELHAWVGRLERLDGRIRALPQAQGAAFDRGHEVDADCVDRYANRLSAEDAQRFRRILALG